jgi:hypothetical protein
MPRKPDPLLAQIRALEQVVRADRAEKRVAQAPLLAERRTHTERVRMLKRNLVRAQERRAAMLHDSMFVRTERDAEWIYQAKWRDCIAAIAKHTVDLAAAEVDLTAFLTQHPELQP